MLALAVDSYMVCTCLLKEAKFNVAFMLFLFQK